MVFEALGCLCNSRKSINIHSNAHMSTDQQILTPNNRYTCKVVVARCRATMHLVWLCVCVCVMSLPFERTVWRTLWTRARVYNVSHGCASDATFESELNRPTRRLAPFKSSAHQPLNRLTHVRVFHQQSPAVACAVNIFSLPLCEEYARRAGKNWTVWVCWIPRKETAVPGERSFCPPT